MNEGSGKSVEPSTDGRIIGWPQCGHGSTRATSISVTPTSLPQAGQGTRQPVCPVAVHVARDWMLGAGLMGPLPCFGRRHGNGIVRPCERRQHLVQRWPPYIAMNPAVDAIRLDDPAGWNKLWSFGGVTLRDEASGARCAAPDEDWRGFVRLLTQGRGNPA